LHYTKFTKFLYRFWCVICFHQFVSYSRSILPLIITPIQLLALDKPIFISFISPPGFSRQAYVMSLLLSFLFFLLFLTSAWSKEISETARPIFTKFSGMVDMLVWMFSLVLVSGLVKDVAMATNFRREIGRNRRHAFLLGTRILQSMAGTAERICAKFTRKTCLVLRSDKLECQS